MENPTPLSTPPETPEAARARIEQLTSDREFAARYAANDGVAIAELKALQEFAYLGKPMPGAPTTPETAKAKLGQLTSSPDFAKKLLANPTGPEQRELTRLEQMASGVTPEAQAPPVQREPGVPEAPSSYMFAAAIPLGAEEVAQNFQTAAHAANLTLGEFESVHRQALRDEKANAGRSEAEIVDQLDRDLHQIWGKDYERRTELLERYVNDYEREHPGTRAFIAANGLQYNLSLLTTLALKALRKYEYGG